MSMLYHNREMCTLLRTPCPFLTMHGLRRGSLSSSPWVKWNCHFPAESVWSAVPSERSNSRDVAHRRVGYTELQPSLAEGGSHVATTQDRHGHHRHICNVLSRQRNPKPTRAALPSEAVEDSRRPAQASAPTRLCTSVFTRLFSEDIWSPCKIVLQKVAPHHQVSRTI